MTTVQSESQIKHHPDDWSTTAEHHHHVERATHPVVVELVKWVCILQESLSFLTLLPLFNVDKFVTLACSYDAKMLIIDTLQATQTVPPDSSSKVFDDACGIGTVTIEFKKRFPDVPVLAIDSSAGMLEVFNRKAKKHGFKDVEARLLDGGKLTGVDTPAIFILFLSMFKPNYVHFLGQISSTPRLTSSRCSL